MGKSFYKAMKDRRTFYAIGGDSPVADARIRKVVGSCVRDVPSAFNCQSARIVTLFGAAHKKLWSIVLETLRKKVPAERFGETEKKINGCFACGHGTVLYFNDGDVTAGLQAQFPSYKDNFPVWAHQASGMLQFAVWAALEQEGLGASLQHYNPLIDDEVKSNWKLPASWQLTAEMPFGAPTAQPGEKTFVPLEQRMKSFDV